MNAIEIKGLEKKYPGFDLKLDLALPQGCIMGLIGENGAGKTTTIKLLLGLIQADSGSIRVLGQSGEPGLRLAKEEIGVVFDEPSFPESLTAKNVDRIMAGIYRHWDSTAYFSHLERLSIPESKPFKSFSRGMKMKLSIAVALSHNARLLILDEPTSGLDPVVRDEVVEIFSEFTRDESRSVLISSHIVSDLEKLCDYIAFLHKGRLLLCEEKDRLLEEYGLVHCAPEELAGLAPRDVIGRRDSAYGASAIVRCSAAPAGLSLSPASIEELFVFMAKEA